jgi:hypothetical protein
MRKPILVALAVVALPLFVSSAAQSTAYKPCSGGFNPDGSKGSFYKSIRAKGIGCPAAKAITKAWVRYEASTDGANPTAKVKIKGYKCSGKAVKSSLVVSCVKGSKAVRFVGHP